MDLNTIRTVGIDHVGLSVRNLSLTVEFFRDCLGWKLLGENPKYPAAFVTDGTLTLTLWQVEHPQQAGPFDRRKNIGLHHLALAVPTKPHLDALHERVSGWPDVQVEFEPELSGGGPKVHFMIREPSGLRIEFAYDPRLEDVRRLAVK